MRSETCGICCGGLCQHPECWRSSIQQVREAVWRRNGVTPSHETSNTDAFYAQKDQNIKNIHGKTSFILTIVYCQFCFCI